MTLGRVLHQPAPLSGAPNAGDLSPLRHSGAFDCRPPGFRQLATSRLAGHGSSRFMAVMKTAPRFLDFGPMACL